MLVMVYVLCVRMIVYLVLLLLLVYRVSIPLYFLVRCV